VVKERTAESALEEVVTQHEFPGHVPQAQRVLRLAVVTHRQATRVTPGDELVIFAIVDLHLVLIEHVPQVAGYQVQRQVFLIGPFEGKGGVGQIMLVLLARGIGHPIDRLRPDLHDPAPGGWQGL